MKRQDSAAPAQIDWNELDMKRYYFFGPLLFLCVRAVVYPSNLVKTRLQVRRLRIAIFNHAARFDARQAQGDNVLYTGTLDAFRKIFRSEGPSGLFKGMQLNRVSLLL